MMMLASARAEDERITIGHIARRLDISERLLADTMAVLIDKGWVESRRGRGGGLRMTDTGYALPVGSLARQLDAVGAPSPDPAPRSIVPAADAELAMRKLMLAAQEAAYRELDTKTLAELAEAATTRTIPIRAS